MALIIIQKNNLKILNKNIFWRDVTMQIHNKNLEELINNINYHCNLYYTFGNPSISDAEFDKMYNELVILEKETGIILPNSPTQRIGNVVLKEFEKHTHKFKCYSMDKAQTLDELKEWDKRNQQFVRENKLPPIQYVVVKKFDGLTINNTYDENGILESSATRGTGEIGELITAQTKTIKSIPLKINNNHLVEIHGEALMTKQAFKKYNETAETPLKNLRNGASGAIKNLNTKETAKRNLSAFFYDVGYNEGIPFKTYIDMMKFIEDMGLPVDKEYYLCNSIDEVKDKIDLIESMRQDLDYEIDGVIVSINDIQTREALSYTIKFPRWAIAYKFEAEETTTTLLDVEWNTGRSGKLTPKGKIEPVELGNVTVKQATLNSMDDIRRKGVKINSKIFIRRSNDVIPEVLGVVEDSIDENTIEILPPTECPSCKSKVIQDGVHYFCPNTINCKPQIVKAIAHFGSREAMDIDGFSEKTADLFVENKIIETVLDLYKLEYKKDLILKLPKFAITKYNNLIKSINKAKTVKLNQFIFALGIPSIGKGSSVKLAEHFKTIDYFLNALSTKYDFTKVEDVGEGTNDEILSWWNLEGTQDLVYGLLDYIKVLDIEEKKSTTEIKDNPFKGKSVYPTGKFSLKKEDLKKKLEELGAVVESGYKKSLDMLIAGGDTSKSGKVSKAEAEGVRIVSEEYLMHYIN
jgi:DNA ligase (NAD+)